MSIAGVIVHTAPAYARDALQAEAERAAAAQANVAILAGSILLLVGGLSALLVLWYLRRDPGVGPMPPSLSEPPSDLPPGLAGALVHRGAGPNEILATLLDLARRGFLRIEEVGGGPARPGRRDVRFRRRIGVGGPREGHERALLAVISDDASLPPAPPWVGRSDGDTLSEMRGRLHHRLGYLKERFGDDLARRGLAEDNPTSVRGRYERGGVALGTVGVVGFAVAIGASGDGWASVPFAALAALGAASAAIGRIMARRTREGAVQAARWRAFAAYLKEVPGRTDERIAGALYERYLPYAVAFGLREPWMKKLLAKGRVDDWSPSWYVPFDAGAGPAAPADGGSTLMIPSLQDLSDGLAGMLNDAGGAFDSGGDGGGGDGGGGDGGGGGGGGD